MVVFQSARIRPFEYEKPFRTAPLDAVTLQVYEENIDYFSDPPSRKTSSYHHQRVASRNTNKDEDMEGTHWKPEEPTWKAPTTNKHDKKEKEQKEKKEDGAKAKVLAGARVLRLGSCIPKPMTAFLHGTAKCAKALCQRMNTVAQAVGLRGAKVVPISEKVQARHLELEPLCCLSSCLVRGGCGAVASFEAVFTIFTTLFCMLMLLEKKFEVWGPLDLGIDRLVNHQLAIYAVLAFNLVQTVMIICLSRGLYTFRKELIRTHLRFDFAALVFNMVALILFSFGYSVRGGSWTLLKVLLVMCFGLQIPLQFWAISVVRSCFDFFSLIQVFVTLADA